MSKQNLSQQQKLLQRQIASQQTIQLMRMIEMPGTGLEQEIRKEIDENPALEIDIDDDIDNNGDLPVDNDNDSVSADDNENSLHELDEAENDQLFDNDFYNDDDEQDDKSLDYQLATINQSKDDVCNEKVIVYDSGFQENLLRQIGEMTISDRERTIAEYIIGNLDNSGYLLRNDQSIANDMLLSFNLACTADEIESIIKRFIHELDPAGVGARNLQECLLIQLNRKTTTPSISLAKTILQDHFPDFSKKHYDKLIKQLSLSTKALKDAVAEITRLEPRPVSSQNYMENVANTITPDFIITNNGEQLTLSLNNNFIPRVKINNNFRKEYKYISEEMNERKRAEAEKFIKDNLENAQSFINTLSLRELVLYNTMYAIMMKQKKYFLTGHETDLKPMVLKDIADTVQLDISTVSRVSNSKYVLTFFGTISLKHLFSESVGNEETSSKEVKKILTDFINNEDKKSPMPDEQLEKILKEKGYSIARRTIAKYREQLGFPVARLRKELL